MTSIRTAYGKRFVTRVVDGYVQTRSRPSAPHGEWWVLNPQTGYVPVPSNSPGLAAAISLDEAKP